VTKPGPLDGGRLRGVARTSRRFFDLRGEVHDFVEDLGRNVVADGPAPGIVLDEAVVLEFLGT
jgi:hypothetical protein